MDWSMAYAAAGDFLEAFCAAAGIDRDALDRQQVVVTLTDHEGESPSFNLDMSIRRGTAGLVDDAALTTHEQRLAAEAQAESQES